MISEKKLRVLLLGSGGREHALADAILKSEFCGELHVAPGNAGIAQIAACHKINIDDNAAVVALAKDLKIDFVIVGPESPLVAGIVDELNAVGIPAFGPTAAAAQLEGSKAFMKNVVVAAQVPTAAHQVFTDPIEAKKYVMARGAPIVIKTDGLAAGKGVTVAISEEDALQAIDDAMVNKIFAESGSTLVIEEYLEGPEISVFALCDGAHAICLGAAQDHKRAYDGDLGPNTGGMGAYAPVPRATDRFKDTVMEQFIFPVLAEMQNRGAPFKGILFAGLIITQSGIRLIEYNVRWGDPETQVIVPRIQADVLQLFWLAAQGKLHDAPAVKMATDAALCVVMAAKGYPGKYEKNTVIKNLAAAENENTRIFHAGTGKNNSDELIATGGRVLGIVGFGKDLKTAQNNAYGTIDKIDWPGGFCRRDIGWRELDGKN
ncbi:MAG TPA: phosphoribosylamine--glycine ligase [Alphaproteobacteria bacterium]|nr:phosphoribosylamine--glycine ligase [Rhodospirillaceae bacterium]HRJ12181.1 phosphoribosylamine--glycine ligase [Alphaproteobacteria bacterium]